MTHVLLLKREFALFQGHEFGPYTVIMIVVMRALYAHYDCRYNYL